MSKIDKQKLAEGAEAIHKAEREAQETKVATSGAKPMKLYEPHPLALAYPPMDAQAIDMLTADIKGNGLQNPIVLFEDKILDGIQRQEACKRAGVEPLYLQFILLPRAIVEAGPKAYVDSQNLHRRHLTKEQQVERIDKELRDKNDFATMARSFNPTSGKRGGSTADEHKAAVIEEASKKGISKRTVERTLAKDKPKRKRKAKVEIPYEPKPDEQHKLDNLEKGLFKLSEFIETSGVERILGKLDSIEKQRWADKLSAVCRMCKRIQ